MAARKHLVTINTGDLPSARGVAEGYDLGRVIGHWQSVAHGSFRDDCRALKKMIAETDELRLWEKNVGGFKYASRDEFLRKQVLIDYELTERDMAEIVAMLRHDDLAGVANRLAQQYQQLDAQDRANQEASQQGRRTDLVSNNENVAHDVDRRPTTGSRARALRKLRDDRPDIHARVLAGALSAHAGMIEAGFRKKTVRKKLAVLEQIQKLWAKLSADERKEHLEWTLNQCATCGRKGTWEGGMPEGSWCDACCEEGIKASREQGNAA